ncbi:MAG: type II toxin-antitoxin system RelE/ParE family toxin [Gammaproteobacteria bacterium]
MSRIELAPELADDFERITSHLYEYDSDQAESRIEGIIQAIDVLASNPCIGRPVEQGLRELVIGQGNKGYLALYRYVEQIDVVFVLAIRAEAESDYRSA